MFAQTLPALSILESPFPLKISEKIHSVITDLSVTQHWVHFRNYCLKFYPHVNYKKEDTKGKKRGFEDGKIRLGLRRLIFWLCTCSVVGEVAVTFSILPEALGLEGTEKRI